MWSTAAASSSPTAEVTLVPQCLPCWHLVPGPVMIMLHVLVTLLPSGLRVSLAGAEAEC